MTDYIRKKDAKEKYTHLLSVAESLNTHVSPDFLDNIPPVTMFDICKECNSESYYNGFKAGYESAKNEQPQVKWFDCITDKTLKARHGNYVLYKVDFLLDNLAREVNIMESARRMKGGAK